MAVLLQNPAMLPLGLAFVNDEQVCWHIEMLERCASSTP